MLDSRPISWFRHFSVCICVWFCHLGNRCRSSWCTSWFLLCTCWMAFSNATSWGGGKAENYRYAWSRKRSNRYVAEKVKHSIVCAHHNRLASFGLFDLTFFFFFDCISTLLLMRTSRDHSHLVQFSPLLPFYRDLIN